MSNWGNYAFICYIANHWGYLALEQEEECKKIGASLYWGTIGINPLYTWGGRDLPPASDYLKYAIFYLNIDSNVLSFSLWTLDLLAA